jgi:hypothetical protein
VTHDEPVLTMCDLCQHRAAAYRVGYLVEVGLDRTYVICAPCLADVLQIAA